jgi:hypothetical protein
MQWEGGYMEERGRTRREGEKRMGKIKNKVEIGKKYQRGREKDPFRKKTKRLNESYHV